MFLSKLHFNGGEEPCNGVSIHFDRNSRFDAIERRSEGRAIGEKRGPANGNVQCRVIRKFLFRVTRR